jgi:hypothetical protein
MAYPITGIESVKREGPLDPRKREEALRKCEIPLPGLHEQARLGRH